VGTEMISVSDRTMPPSPVLCCLFSRIELLFAWPRSQNFAATCSKYFKLTGSVLLLLRESWLSSIKWWCINWNEKILY